MMAITSAPKVTTNQRIVSIDALRGFDMFWIMGPELGNSFVSGLVILMVGHLPESVSYQLEHHWGTFGAWDMIMPLFLFIAGVSLPFSIGRRIEAGDGRQAIYLRALRRVVILWILGMISQGNLLQFRLDHLKVYSNTLQSIAVGYLVATVALVELRTVARQTVLCASLLIGFALVMLYVPPPGGVAGDFSPNGNLACWIDKTVMGHFMDGGGYTWILSSLGFAATVIMGSLAGHALKAPLPGARKVLILTGAGIACLILGWAANFAVPIIKHLWTSSMVLWAGGWSLLLLALFYLVIDVLGYKRWAFPLQVIGANAIVAYMAEKLFGIEHICRGLFGGLCAHFGPARQFTLTCLSILFLWSLLYYLYRNRTFVRI